MRGDAFQTMKHYKEHAKTQHGASTVQVGLAKEGPITIVKFVNRKLPEFRELMEHQLIARLGTGGPA